MDIWTLISIGCGIYLIWFYWRRRKRIKEAQEELKKAEENIDKIYQQLRELGEKWSPNDETKKQ